jgi:hypothetical protein
MFAAARSSSIEASWHWHDLYPQWNGLVTVTGNGFTLEELWLDLHQLGGALARKALGPQLWSIALSNYS